MNPQHQFWGLVVLAVGVLQAWDSGAVGSGPVAIVLIGLAVAAPSLSLLVSAGRGVLAAAVLAMCALLTVARMAAPVPLAGLHIMLVPAAFLALMSWRQPASAPR